MACCSLALRLPPLTNPNRKHPSHLPRFPLAATRPLTSGLPSPLRLGKWGPVFAVGASRSEDEPVREEMEEWRQSSLPDRFRPLTKEAPDPPLLWPWLVAAPFLIYTWKAVIWELSKWAKIFVPMVVIPCLLVVRSVQLFLASLFNGFWLPINAVINVFAFCLNLIKPIYFSIVAFAPVQELSTIIILSSLVLAISEAASPNSVDEQSYLISLAGFVGFGAVRGFVPEGLFWLALIGFFCYSKFSKKRDDVSAALPSIAVLVAVGEPWIRVLTMTTFLACAILQHSKSSQGGAKEIIVRTDRRSPVPLFFVALAIGIHVAAKWIRYRHLTWMIV